MVEKSAAPMEDLESINKIVVDYMGSNNRRIDDIEKHRIGTLESNVWSIED